MLILAFVSRSRSFGQDGISIGFAQRYSEPTSCVHKLSSSLPSQSAIPGNLKKALPSIRAQVTAFFRTFLQIPSFAHRQRASTSTYPRRRRETRLKISNHVGWKGTPQSSPNSLTSSQWLLEKRVVMPCLVGRTCRKSPSCRL